LSLFVSLLLSILNSNAALGSAWNLGSICTTDCWFAIWPISWQGGGRQEETKERGGLVGVRFNKFTDKAYVECPQTVISAPTSHNLESLYRGLNWVQSWMPTTWSRQHIVLSRTRT